MTNIIMNTLVQSYLIIILVIISLAATPLASNGTSGSSSGSAGSSVPEAIEGEPHVDEWVSWKEKYNKQYASEDEEVERFLIWQENLEKVQMHNSQSGDQPEQSFSGVRLGMNEYADFTQQEFLDTLLGHRILPMMIPDESGSGEGQAMMVGEGEVPEEQDWREKGYVTSVKYQDHCGSCWAFSAAGALEGQYFNKTGQLVDLSAQQMLDCTDNSDCSGGNVEFALKYLIERGSISDYDYPYTADDTQPCMDQNMDIVTTMSSYDKIPKGDEEKLREAVGLIGPVSAAIDSAHFAFQFYESGVFYEPNCDPDALNHSVLIVGYGTSETGEEYWIVKNTWGADWGMDGYFRLARNRENNCGIASYSMYPVI